MDDQQIGTYHLADNPQIYEIQRSNNFEFILTDLDGLIRTGTQGTEDNATFKNAQEVLKISVLSSSVPHFSQGVIELKRGNSTIKYAGVPTFGAGSVVFQDFIGADTQGILDAWQALSYNVLTQKVGTADKYKKDAYLIEYTPDYKKVRQFRLHGCWISELSEDTFSHEDNNKHTITATIQYDRAEIDLSE